MQRSVPYWMPLAYWTPLAFVFLLATSATAQIDRVYTTDGNSVTGTVSAIAKAGIQLQKGSSTQTISASEIVKILWEGDPGELTNARESALSGQFESAISELKKLDTSKLRREGQQSDFAYLKALSIGEMALAGRGSPEAAAAEVGNFLRSNSDSFHFYNATELFGHLALALDKPDDAMRYYGFLGRSPSGDTKIRAVYLVGKAKAHAGNHAEAIADFDKVIGAAARSSESVQNQTLAKAAKAKSLAALDQADAGLAIIESLIKDLVPTDVATAAAIYNAQGVIYEAAGDIEAAIASYLHTHLMYASDAQRHAFSLDRLVPLWEQVGQPGRASEMRSLLKELYPGI